jgi:transcriptional regulator with XRE-family HTH domain
VADNELGRFLRIRRETVKPAQVGLPAGPRRRAAGLRRSEVAALAGVSVEYVTRLEQGRDRHPSAQILTALADALQLTPSYRVHLYRLSKGADPGFTCRGSAGPARTVRASVRAILDRLEPAPALVLNQVADILAYTSGFALLARPIGLLDQAQPNLARFVFTDERARAAYPDWDHIADQEVAALKAGPFLADPQTAALADELTIAAGDVFTRRVDTVTGPPQASGVMRLAHPDAGELRLAYETLELPADDGQRLLVQLPADPASGAAIDRLQGQRSLRLMSG